MLPCKGNYLDLMNTLDELSFAQERSIDLNKSLKMLKLALKGSKTLKPRVVIVTSSLPEEALSIGMTEKVGRLDCVYLRQSTSMADEKPMSDFCADHLGKLICLDPFDSLLHTWQWQEDLLSQLGISQKESTLQFQSKSGETARNLRLFPAESNSMRSRSSLRMVESCRGESLDSYQHLSSDGFAHSWLPSYANLAKKYKEKGFPPHYYLLILDTLCKWQTVFSVKAGRMVTSERSGGKKNLEPLKKQGVLKLLYSSDADSWCMQWKQMEGSDVQGLPPLTSKRESKEDEYSVRFTGPSKVKFESVTCHTGEVVGVHLLSTLYKRQPAFFWLQENFTCEQGTGAQGLVRKLEDIVNKNDQKSSSSSSSSSSSRQPLLIKTLGSEMQLETVLLNLMSSSSNKPDYPTDCERERKSSSASSSEAKEKETEAGIAKENELDKGFYSWMHTAQLDAELTTEDSNLAQIQTSHNIGKSEVPSTQGAEVKETEDSLLFELD